jgi:hypothetical protein
MQYGVRWCHDGKERVDFPMSSAEQALLGAMRMRVQQAEEGQPVNAEAVQRLLPEPPPWTVIADARPQGRFLASQEAAARRYREVNGGPPPLELPPHNPTFIADPLDRAPVRHLLAWLGFVPR